MTTEVAIPRLRSNQWVMFATRGTMIVDIPKNPTSTPNARTICHRAVAWAASSRPDAIATLPVRAGHIVPTRSDHQPIRIPPRPNPAKSVA